MQETQVKTYLVTGGAGFIGSHMVDALLKAGNNVRVVDNFLTGKRENLAHVKHQIDLREISITDLDALQDAMNGVDYVFHFAALPSVPRSVKSPLASNDNNVNGTLNVLIAARDNDVKRVVYVGSSSAYGDVDAPFKSEEMLPHPRSPYAAAKLAGEHYCQSFFHVYGLETVVVRYFNVFGPRQDPLSLYSAVIPKFINAMLKGDPPPIEGDGHQSRDFTYVDNVVHGNLLACHAEGVAGETFNIACGGNINLLDMVDTLNTILGTQIDPIFVAPRPGDVRHSQAAIGKARDMLRYKPVVSFGEGLKRTVEWLKQSGEPV